MASTVVGRGKEILSENIQMSKMKSVDISKQNNSRKTLQTIQFTAGSNNHLFGKENLIDASIKMKQKSDKNEAKITKIKKTTDPVKVYCDKGPTVLHDCKETQTVQQLACKETQTESASKKSTENPDEEAYNLMASEEVPMEYWMQIAERRRLALSDALSENKTLHREVLDLKEENEKLHELSGQAEYFAELLKDVLKEEGEEADEEEKNSEKLTGDEDSVKGEEDNGASSTDEEHCDSESDKQSLPDLDNETVSTEGKAGICDKEKVPESESKTKESLTEDSSQNDKS